MSITFTHYENDTFGQQFIQSIQNIIQNNPQSYPELNKRLEILPLTNENQNYILSRVTPPINYNNYIRFLISPDPQLLSRCRKQSSNIVTIYTHYPGVDTQFASQCQKWISQNLDLNNLDHTSLAEYLERNSKDVPVRNDWFYIVIGLYRTGAITFLLNLEHLIENRFDIEMELQYLNHRGLKYAIVGFPFGQHYNKYLNELSLLADKMAFKLVKGYPTADYNCDFPIQYPETYTLENIMEDGHEMITKTEKQIGEELSRELSNLC